MRALVIGYGSIGRRHTGILGTLGIDVAVLSRRSVDAPKLYADLGEALERGRPDYVVIASRTSEHIGDLRALARAGFRGTTLIEKPIFHADIEPPAGAFAHCFVGYNLRFHPVIQRFRSLVRDRQVIAAHVYVGQYLPDWRPGTDYRAAHSASTEEGGGVLRELSHELDYVTWILGRWRRLAAAGGHLSGLEITSDDVFSIIVETDRCPLVTINMNYLDSVARREVIALTDRGTVRADLVNGTVEHDGGTESLAADRDASYIGEHRAALDGDGGTICSVAEAMEVMAMIEAAERAGRERIWVER